MDWSMNPLQAPASPSLHVASASEHVPLPHVLSHNKDSNGKNRAEPTASLILNYSKGQPAISHNWDGAHHALSIFGTENTLTKDSEMMYDSIMRLRSFIQWTRVQWKENFHPLSKCFGSYLTLYTLQNGIHSFSTKKRI